jgi:hypothetical protein
VNCSEQRIEFAERRCSTARPQRKPRRRLAVAQRRAVGNDRAARVAALLGELSLQRERPRERAVGASLDTASSC